MKVYNYDPFTKIFGGIADADPNPVRKGEYLIPAFCTTIQPPAFNEGQQAYWNGSAWEIQNISQPEPEPEPEPVTWENIRNKRFELLFLSDWVGLTDSNPPNKQAWLDYRQALRDIPQNFSTPESVVWPEKP